MGPIAEKKAVFVVDRDVFVRRLLTRFLGDAYEVTFFDDGYTALDHARRHPPAVLITEIMVPELDGLAMCRLLKGDQSTKRIPILVLSVLGITDQVRSSGADAFLAKPIERQRLFEAVELLTAPRERGSLLPTQKEPAS